MRCSVILFLLLLPTTAFPTERKGLAACGDLHQALSKPVQDFSLSEPTFVEALTHAASEFQVPIGIEWVRDRRTTKRVHISEKHSTARGVLTAVVSTQPGYQLDVENCVVHIFPSALAKSKANFLNIRLDEFNVFSAYTGTVNGKLLSMAHSLVSPRPMRVRKGPHGTMGSIQIGAGETPMTFTMKNPTVRQILNRIATNSGFHVWVATFSPDATLTPTGFRKTEWADGKLRPNERQPIWEIFPWGTDPVGYVQRNDWPRPKE